MLRYLGSGPRRFDLYPVPPHQRADWEFFAVVRGRCAALLANTKIPVFHERHLWVFPPASAHGWTARPGKACQVAVFHFAHVPPLLDRLTRQRGHLDTPLTIAQARRLASLERELRRPLEYMTERSQLVFEKAVLELSLLALEPIPFATDETQSDQALRKVEACLRWYSDHMSEQPKLEHAAQAVHVSPSHLRRLFWQTRRENPLCSFTKLRLERAMELLSHSSLKLDAVASKCGFSSAADFCRVFKSYNHITPDAWRRSKLGPYPESFTKSGR